ncbi:MAG: tRNA lysidine(34) synthetase TilS [Buchnera aphidicola (Nurudea yanoniella)]
MKNFNFLLAYSGGIDSTFLFHKLLKIKKNKPTFNFRAIHINHQLNENSNIWSKHCKQTCKTYNIPIIIKKITLNTKKTGLEEAARIQRYKAIYDEVLPEEIILTAHNLNDQCETFFLSLKRGSGISGLSGISYKSKLFNKNTIMRPLLNTTRFDIEYWMIKNNIPWIEDTSNYDTSYDRNFLRHTILPLLTKRWTNFTKKCAKSILILKKEKKFLDTTINKILKQNLISNSILNIKIFKIIPSELRHILLRTWIKNNNFVIPSHKAITNIYYEIILSKKDSKAKIKIKNYEIKRYKHNLYISNSIPCIKQLILMWYYPFENLKLPNNLGYIIQNQYGTMLPYPKKSELVNIRFQISGKFVTKKNKKRTSIKKIWKENNIAPWHRNNIPLLFYNNTFISALGIFTIHDKNYIPSNNIWYLSWTSKIRKN